MRPRWRRCSSGARRSLRRKPTGCTRCPCARTFAGRRWRSNESSRRRTNPCRRHCRSLTPARCPRSVHSHLRPERRHLRPEPPRLPHRRPGPPRQLRPARRSCARANRHWTTPRQAWTTHRRASSYPGNWGEESSPARHSSCPSPSAHCSRRWQVQPSPTRSQDPVVQSSVDVVHDRAPCGPIGHGAAHVALFFV